MKNKVFNLNKRFSLEHECNSCSDLNRKQFLIKAIDKWDNVLSNFNNPSLAGTPATTRMLFGDLSRYALFAVHTRFDDIHWIITDAETIDQLTGKPDVIAQEYNLCAAIERVNKLQGL